MRALRIKQFGLLVAVLAAFPSFCCGQFAFDASFKAEAQPVKDSCCHSESPVDSPSRPANRDCECCNRSEVTLPSNAVKIPQGDLACVLPVMIAVDSRPNLPTTFTTATGLGSSGLPLHLLQCVWLN